jgi:hypothetical protein
MPIEVKIVHNGVGVEFITSGTVTGKEIIETNDHFNARKNLNRLRYKLVDRTACLEYPVSADEMKIIAQQDDKLAELAPGIIFAFVSTAPVQYGLTRMWDAYTRIAGSHREIFSDQKSAMEWLRSQIPELKADTE